MKDSHLIIVLGAVSITLSVALFTLSFEVKHYPKVNHPEGSEMHPVYQMMRKDKDGLTRNHLFMDPQLFKRSVECAKTNDGCRDTLILNEPAAENLGGHK